MSDAADDVTATGGEAVPATPDRFRAFLVEHLEDRVRRGVGELTLEDLPAGDVLVRVEWSGVNFKDGLAARFDGKVARISPLVPGIDLAGEVAASDDPAFPVGSKVIVHGHDLGVSRHGGFAEYARVPAEWVVPLPAGLDARSAMAIGTAGFTAAMAVDALESHGVHPGSGPVLVTGASGGVGRSAVAILAPRGHEVWAETGKPAEADRLRALGAAGVVPREEVTAESGRPLETGRWAGAVDAVGGPSMPYILRTLRPRGVVASIGNAGGAAFSTTVLPFILRGVALLGMDSAWLPIEDRRRLWARLADDLRPAELGSDLAEIGLDDLEGPLDAIVDGGARGRWIVRVAAGA
jgi:acrylyl-CoA reductase (NADPH)